MSEKLRNMTGELDGSELARCQRKIAPGLAMRLREQALHGGAKGAQRDLDRLLRNGSAPLPKVSGKQ